MGKISSFFIKKISLIITLDIKEILKRV